MNKDKFSGAASLKKFFLMLVIGFCLIGKAFASDNVLQAIQINGIKDSYSIILKSDDLAEIKKTIQAPNKMMLNLKGIRASKTINTIYNGTSGVDSVVVVPVDNDSVKILIQADNVSNAEVHFDSLKTPLGILSNNEQQLKPSDEIVLSNPIDAYKPIYQDDSSEEEINISFGLITNYLKKVLKSDKINWMITFGLFSMFLISGMKIIKGKDNEIKVGLTQSLKEREMELYRGGLNINPAVSNGVNPDLSNSNVALMQGQNVTGSYGLRAYQQGTRNPYVSAEIQRPKTPVTPSVSPVNLQKVIQGASIKPQVQTSSAMQNTFKTQAQGAVKQGVTGDLKSKVANIDSMKFLESMTKIYEKNGRTDLAQGLKSNMKKAKINLA